MNQNELCHIAVVIRSFCNPGISGQVKNLLGFGVGMVTVVVNSHVDKKSTASFLKESLKDSRLRIIEMSDGYTWSNALNRALMSIKMINLKSIESKKINYILNLSVEVQISKDHLTEMQKKLIADPGCGVIGTSHQGVLNDSEISLGRSYRHPRNTCMMIRVDTNNFYWPTFDNRCDDIGGMEDIDFILGVLCTTNFHFNMLDLRVPLMVGIHYNQHQKEKREQEAMDKIIFHWRFLFPKDTYERIRIDDAISFLSLEQ